MLSRGTRNDIGVPRVENAAHFLEVRIWLCHGHTWNPDHLINLIEFYQAPLLVDCALIRVDKQLGTLIEGAIVQ